MPKLFIITISSALPVVFGIRLRLTVAYVAAAILFCWFPLSLFTQPVSLLAVRSCATFVGVTLRSRVGEIDFDIMILYVVLVIRIRFQGASVWPQYHRSVCAFYEPLKARY